MIGMLVARRCRGLPLAVVVVAGLLSAAGQSRVAWERVAENVNLAVSSNSEQFAEILSLSYTHLPHHLRPCFLYMGRFREDREIHASKLIKLWIAEGFLKASVSKSFEEAAEEYLEDLVKRCLVLVTKRKSNGKIKSCSVHDLVRDLCINKAQEEKFLLHVRKRHFDNFLPKFLKDQRRLIIHDFSLALYSNMCSPAIRSLLLFADCQILRDSIKSFRFLRVLDAVGLRFKYFPEEVIELIHLRYLAFTNSEIGDFHLPASILRLWNLQTLLIYPYSKRYVSYGGGVSFPLEIWRMAQLRHLVIFMIDPLPNPSCSVPSASASALENLQTLATVTNFKCTKRVVGKIPNLKKLGIIYDGDRINWELYRLNNLVHLHQLEILKICVERGRRKPCPLWENLAFPVTLKKLTLRGCLLSRNDMGTIGSLPNLEVLKLKDCFFKNSKWETAEGEFPHLQFLQIIHTNLQQWITESEHFPQLRWLTLCRCERLSEIPGVIGEIATLELIEVNHRDRSLVESAQQIKEEQESYGYDSLQVRIVSNSNYYYFY